MSILKDVMEKAGNGHMYKGSVTDTDPEVLGGPIVNGRRLIDLLGSSPRGTSPGEKNQTSKPASETSEPNPSSETPTQTGQPTGLERVTDRGFLPPEDPIYSAGPIVGGRAIFEPHKDATDKGKTGSKKPK